MQRKHKTLNFLFSPIETYFEEHYRQYANYLTVISRALQERAVRLGFPENKIAVIPPLVDLENFFPIDKQDARKRLNLTQYSHILIFSGFVLYDLNLVFQSFKKVHEQYPKCLLILTGGVPNSMTKQIAGLPFLNTGFISDEKLNDYLGTSDLCLMPLADCLTNRARFPHKIGHYLAVGRPVVSNLIGDGGKLLSDSGAGIMTKPNPEAFAGKICEYLQNVDRLNQLGLTARRTAENCLSYAQYSNKLESIYLSLTGKHAIPKTPSSKDRLVGCGIDNPHE